MKIRIIQRGISLHRPVAMVGAEEHQSVPSGMETLIFPPVPVNGPPLSHIGDR